MLYEGGRLYIVHTDDSERGKYRVRLSVFDTEDGSLLWQSRVTHAEADLDWLTCRPRLHRGLVYVCLAEGNLHAFDASSGKEIWRWGLGGGGSFDFLSILKGERVIEVLLMVGADNEVFGLELSDDPLPWREITVKGHLSGQFTKLFNFLSLAVHGAAP